MFDALPQLPQAQQKPFDQSAFNASLMQSMMSPQGGDPIDRMSRFAAQDHAKFYNANQQGLMNRMQRGDDLGQAMSDMGYQAGGLPSLDGSSTAPTMRQKMAQTVPLTGEDGKSYNATMMPLGLAQAGGQMPWDINQNYMQDLQRGFTQYGPGFMSFMM